MITVTVILFNVFKFWPWYYYTSAALYKNLNKISLPSLSYVLNLTWSAFVCTPSGFYNWYFFSTQPCNLFANDIQYFKIQYSMCILHFHLDSRLINNLHIQSVYNILRTDWISAIIVVSLKNERVNVGFFRIKLNFAMYLFYMPIIWELHLLVLT